MIEKICARLEELYDRNDRQKKSAYEEEDWGKFKLFMHRNDGIYSAIQIVQEVAKNGGWIPCSERLPEIEADVLLSLRSLDIYTGFRANTEGCFYVEGEGYVEFENVLAWQPLPAPYQKGE